MTLDVLTCQIYSTVGYGPSAEGHIDTCVPSLPAWTYIMVSYGTLAMFGVAALRLFAHEGSKLHVGQVKKVQVTWAVSSRPSMLQVHKEAASYH